MSDCFIFPDGKRTLYSNVFLGGAVQHYSLLYKELDRLGKTNPNVRRELRQVNLEVIRPCLSSKFILDLDSTVETVYGNQD
nr:hypothetical protein [Paenibacillus peoriae]